MQSGSITSGAGQTYPVNGQPKPRLGAGYIGLALAQRHRNSQDSY